MSYNPHAVKTRVLFSGLGIATITELMEKAGERYEVEKCPGRPTEFLVAITKLRPHAVVICLQNELVQELNAYYALAESQEHENIPVIVVGRGEECEQFRSKILVKNLTVIGRPVNLDLFLSKLDTLTEGATDKEEALIKADEAEADEADDADKDDEPQGTQPAATEADELPEPERKSILVVDDDVLMLNTIKAQLQDMYDITVVPNGKLALKFLSKRHADLVLLDYLMPDMTGPQVLEEIRLNTPNPEVPVLFLTGVSDREMVMKSLVLKPNGYLLKPASREELIERVTEILLGL